MIEQLQHSQIHASPLNPRKRFDADQLDDLAESILQEGLLQNLVVRPNGDGFEIAAGERRWRAIGQLIAAGQVEPDFPIPAAVRDLTDLQLLQLATTENMNRADMTPLEEARAFQHMLELGADVESIAAETGFTRRTVQQRLALVERLTGAAQEALAAGQINLGQAQALSATSPVFQDSVVNDLGEGHRLSWDAAQIRRHFRLDVPTVSVAKFPLSEYTGTFTKPNIFSDDEEDRFDDVEQFKELQAKAVERLAEEARRSWAWVEVRDYPNLYEFDDVDAADDYNPAELGVVIEFNPRWGNGSVKIHERLRKRETTNSGSAPKVEADPLALTKKHVAEIARIRSHALQDAVTGAPARIVKQALIMLLLPRLSLQNTLGEARRTDIEISPNLQTALDTYDVDAPVLHGRLTDDTPAWHPDAKRHDPELIWQELMNLGNSALDLLLSALTARVLTVTGSHVSDATKVLFEKARAAEHLPTFATLGSDWAGLYKPGRLKQVSEVVLGFAGEGKTKKELVALIDAAQSQDVPVELQLEQQEPEV